MIEHSAVAVLEQLKAYIAEWQKLEREYYRIPSWRTFKQLKNIRQRERLTKAFTLKMKRWGVIDE